MCLEDKLDTALDVIERLIDQNARLNSRMTALQNMTAFVLSELYIDKHDPERRLADLTSEISGTAFAIADQLRELATSKVPGLREVSQTMEKVCLLAENTLHERLASPRTPAQG